MAQKRPKNGNSERTGFTQGVEWVNVNLTSDDVAEIEGWLVTEPDILGELCRLVTEGYGVTIKPANRGGGFMATATLSSNDERAVSRGLSAFADTPYEAAACLLFKLIYKLDGGLAYASPSVQSRFR